MGKQGQAILAIIDQRIDSYLKESKLTSRSIGQVQEVLGNNRYKVKIIGYDTIYTFPSRPYVDAIKNDYVYIESKIGNIDNGMIIDKLSGAYGYVYNANGSDDLELNRQGGMLKTIYDKNNNGIVDNAEKVNNHTIYSDVPLNAVFTDTTIATSLNMASGQTIEAKINQIDQLIEKNNESISGRLETLEDDGFYF